MGGIAPEFVLCHHSIAMFSTKAGSSGPLVTVLAVVLLVGVGSCWRQ